MNIDQAIATAVAEFTKAMDHLKNEFARLQVGRANSSLVEDVPVEVYGSHQPIKAVANISIPEPRSIVIQPWDKGNLVAIEKAIVGIGTGLNPVNDGVIIRINIPPLTEERRMQLTKKVKEFAETAKISIRTARQDAHNEFKKLKTNNEITEDDLHSAEKKLQGKVDEANTKIDEMAKAKEKEVMTV